MVSGWTARRLAGEEPQEVWARLERRLSAFDGRPEPLPQTEAVLQYDYGAYPGNFPGRRLVPVGSYPPLPDEALIAAIKEAMDRLGERSLYFLAREYAQGDEEKGLDWEITLAELTRATLDEISPGFECYLYSVADAWAIYFHHEGFAFCAGASSFMEAVATHCERFDVGEG